MATILTPAQEAARREGIRALAVLLALEITGRNRDDDESMPCSLGDPSDPPPSANSPFPDLETGSTRR